MVKNQVRKLNFEVYTYVSLLKFYTSFRFGRSSTSKFNKNKTKRKPKNKWPTKDYTHRNVVRLLRLLQLKEKSGVFHGSRHVRSLSGDFFFR